MTNISVFLHKESKLDFCFCLLSKVEWINFYPTIPAGSHHNILMVLPRLQREVKFIDLLKVSEYLRVKILIGTFLFHLD